MLNKMRDWSKPELLTRIRELENGIIKHHSQRGHELCHENDRDLYALVGLEKSSEEYELPSIPQFLEACIIYRNGFEKTSLPVCEGKKISKEAAEQIIERLRRLANDLGESC